MERTTTTGLLLLTQPHPNYLFLFSHPHHRLCPHLKHPNLSSSRRRTFRPATRWDSNADPTSNQDGKRRWWSDEDSPDTATTTTIDGGGFAYNWNRNWNRFVDSVWIFKVLKPFGWSLPFVFFSLMLATDAQAFLTTFAVSIGLSPLFEKWFGSPERRPRRKAKTRKKPFSSRTVSNSEVEEEVEETRETRKGTTGYQSWVAANEDSIEKDEKDVPSFGGWDELDKSGYEQKPGGSIRRQSGSQKRPVKKAKLSRKERSSGTPLVLRLLYAVFPFLSSWTRML